jgi:hypothetical protein
MKFTVEQLRAMTEADARLSFHKQYDYDSFVWVYAGRGEIQLDESGYAWWLRWDRTGAVSEEQELTPPDTADPLEIIAWLLDTAKQFDER